MVKTSVQNIYEFENFRLDVAHLMLYRGDEEISLAPKAVQTLLTLIERRGEIISKDELMETIWNDSIVEEANLTQYVHVLRKTLGTSANGKPLIETLRRRGYRFNGDVRCVHAQMPAAKPDIFAPSDWNGNGNSDASTSEFVRNTSPVEIKHNRIILKTIAFAAFIGAVILGVSAFWNSGKTETPANQNAVQIALKRLTPDQNALQPTISPDGKYMVYSMPEKSLLNTLWLKDLTSGSAVQIMPEGQYLDFAFSSDSTQIYYLTSDFGGPNSSLVRIPLFGGKPQIITKNVISPPAVSPDGKRIAVIKADSGLTVLNENGETESAFETLVPNFTALMWGSQMSWSPDGERIAICGKNNDGQPRILDYSIKSRAGQFLPASNFSEISSAWWLADGSGLLIMAKEKAGEPYQIWRIAYPSGEASRITRDFNDYDWISLSANSKTLVVGQNITKTNVWIAPLDDIGNAKKLTSGSEAQDGYRGLAFAPDDKIIFASPRSGNIDLWQMNRDGSNQQQLTANQGSLNIMPRSTSDGRYIVFVSSRNGDAPHIWRMDADGQNPLQLTKDSDAQSFYDITTDGKRIFYATSNEQKQMTTRQVSIGGGEPSAIADSYRSSGSIAASPDGKLLMRYVYLSGQQQPWKFGIFPLEGGEPLNLMEIPAHRNFVRWAADGKSLLYIKAGTSQLWRQPIDGSPPVMLFDLKNGRLFNFAVSPDYKQIVFAQGSQFNEAVLIENFGKQ